MNPPGQHLRRTGAGCAPARGPGRVARRPPARRAAEARGDPRRPSPAPVPRAAPARRRRGPTAGPMPQCSTWNRRCGSGPQAPDVLDLGMVLNAMGRHAQAAEGSRPPIRAAPGYRRHTALGARAFVARPGRGSGSGLPAGARAEARLRGRRSAISAPSISKPDATMQRVTSTKRRWPRVRITWKPRPTSATRSRCIGTPTCCRISSARSCCGGTRPTAISARAWCRTRRAATRKRSRSSRMR